MKKSCTHNTMRDQKRKKSGLLSSVSLGLILQHANYGSLTSQPVHVFNPIHGQLATHIPHHDSNAH